MHSPEAQPTVTSYYGFNKDNKKGLPTIISVQIAVLLKIYETTFVHQLFDKISKNLSIILEEEPSFVQCADAYKYPKLESIYTTVSSVHNKIRPSDLVPLIPENLGGITIIEGQINDSNQYGIDPVMQRRINNHFTNKLPHEILLTLLDKLHESIESKTSNSAQTIKAKIGEIQKLLSTDTIYKTSIKRSSSTPSSE